MTLLSYSAQQSKSRYTYDETDLYIDPITRKLQQEDPGAQHYHCVFTGYVDADILRDKHPANIRYAA